MSDNQGSLKLHTYRSDEELNLDNKIFQLFKDCPIPQDQILSNLGLFMHSRDLARLLFMEHIFKQIVEVPGVVMDFGTRWGVNMALFAALRGMYDPYNRTRKIIGFDTFTGFPASSISDVDNSPLVKEGNVSAPDGYVQYLEGIMDWHEKSNPLGHIKKYEICVGDASVEIANYFDKNPETIVSLAYFDINLYKPTKDCLEAIKPHLVKGSLIAFDEINDHDMQGETKAFKEVFDINNIRLKRLTKTSRTSYFILE